MTTVEMMYEFQSLLESSLPIYKDSVRIDSDKIMLHLNIGYRRFILNRYLNSATATANSLNIDSHKDELFNLITFVNIPASRITAGSLSEIGWEVNLPEDFYYYIRSDVEINRTDGIAKLGNSWVNVELLDSYKTLENAKATVFNTPILRKPLAIINGSKLIIITDKYTNLKSGNSCTLTYLKTPKNLAFDNTVNTTTIPEITESLHEEIVKYSYQLFMSNISFSNRVNNQENDN